MSDGAYPRVRIRHSEGFPQLAPTVDFLTIELDGKILTTVTAFTVEAAVGGLTKVTLTMFAQVDIDTPAKVMIRE